jgi:plastocyanin domain-containing protein
VNKLRRLIAAALPGVIIGGAAGSWSADARASGGEIEIIVENGYHPNRVTVVEGQPVRLKFIRREHTPCTREVVIPAANVWKELPPNKPVSISLPALAPGEYEFKCGMNMIRGTIEVKPRS